MRNEKKTLSSLEQSVALPIASELASVTATVGGATTGVIAAGKRIVTATGVNGQTGYLVTLPAITADTKPIYITNNSGYAFKIQSDTPADVYINGAKGSVALSLATAKCATCIPTSTTSWVIVIGDCAAAS